MFTPSFLPRILHVLAASWTGGLGAGAERERVLHPARTGTSSCAKSCFRLALPIFARLRGAEPLRSFGANQAIEVTNHQQLKLAAIEGLWDDRVVRTSAARRLGKRVGAGDEGHRHPCLLSFLSYGNFHSTVPGLNSFSETCPAPSGSEWDQCGYPAVNLAFQAYHVMINLAMFFALMGVVGGGLYFWKKKIFQWRWVLWLFVGAGGADGDRASSPAGGRRKPDGSRGSCGRCCRRRTPCRRA